jgi:site-specific recombinase XerD
MPTDLIVTVPQSEKQIGPLADIADRASEFASHSKAANTIRAYRADWSHFAEWCTAHGQKPLPATAEFVALYVSDLSSTHKTATITRRLSAISQVHQIAGLESPSRDMKVRLVMAGIRRTKGTAQAAKAPVLIDDLRRMVAQLPQNILGTRDRALLVIGFGGAFRRSELTGLDRSDIEISEDGLVATLRRSKTDQEGQGRKVGLPYGSRRQTCPVRSLQAWLETSGITEGPLFRPVNRHGRIGQQRLSTNAVACVVKRYAQAAGLDASKLAGHSLRAGLATSAAMAGASERAIMNQTGHRSVTMVRKYIRDGSLFRENAAATVGL